MAEDFGDEVAAGLAELLDTFGQPATFTKQSTGVATPLSALLRVGASGIDASITIAAADVATAPLKDDGFVFTGSTATWFVVRVNDGLALRGLYRLECRSNAAE